MRTLGVDLSSQPENTAACIIDWSPEQAVVSELKVGCADVEILCLANHTYCDAIGIDAPFGWPLPFVSFLRHYLDPDPTKIIKLEGDTKTHCYRRTDFCVKEVLGRWPLSVSTDKIAYTALRCTRLLEQLNVTDRTGDGRVFEVYPAVALKAWGFADRGYKGQKSQHVLAELFSDVGQALPKLCLTDDMVSCVSKNDHAFDALISSLVARAAKCGLTKTPSEKTKAVAKREGWIAIPHHDSLAKLVDAGIARLAHG